MSDKAHAQPPPVEYIQHWYSMNEANRLTELLTNTLNWQVEYLTMFGKKIKVPRMICWYSKYAYTYSKTIHLPQSVTNELRDIVERLNQEYDTQFDGILGNLYRNGEDSMGWHSDNESEICQHHPIASLSFGVSRYFDIRLKQNNANKRRFTLESGSLLIMGPGMQAHWQHQVPKQKSIALPRINLTFRKMNNR